MNDDIVTQWLETVSAPSRRIYLPVVQGFLLWIAPACLTELGPEQVGAWSASLVGSEKTRARCVSTVASLLKFAYRNGRLSSDLSIGLKRVSVSARPKQPIDREGIEDIIAASCPGRDRSLLRLMYECGLHIPEVVGLRFGRVGSLGAPPDLLQDMRALRAEDDTDESFVFKSRTGKPLDARDAREVFYNAAREAGFPGVPSNMLRRAHFWRGTPRPYTTRPKEAGPYGLVYGLHDPSGALRYVGQTRQSIEQRRIGHLAAQSLKKRTRVARWLKSRAEAGQRPIAAVLATAGDRDELLYLERYHIEAARRNGAQLVNSTHLRFSS